MKKFLTLFMATVVAMSAWALPQKVVGKQLLSASQQHEMASLAQTKAQKVTKNKMLQRDFKRQEMAENISANKLVGKHFAAAAVDTIHLEFDQFMVGPEFYEDYEEWYISLGNEDWMFRFDFYAPYGENGEGYCGTFTTEDMELGYSYMLTPDWEEVSYKEVTLTIKKDSIDANTDVISLEAQILGYDDILYIVKATHKILIPNQTIESVITGASASFDVDNALFTLTAKNEDWDITLNMYANWPTGPFSLMDMDAENTKFIYKGVEQTLQSADILLALTTNTDNMAGYSMQMQFINQDIDLHILDIFAPLPTPTDTVEIEVSNTVIDESMASDYTWIFFTSVTSEWDIYAGVSDWELWETTYYGQDGVIFYITNLLTEEFSEQLYAEATVTNDAELGWVLEIKSYNTNGKLYIVKMYNKIPTPTDTITLRFEQPAQAAYYPTMDNDLILAHNENNYYVALDVHGVEMGGDFTKDNLDMNYTLIFTDYANRVQADIANVEGSIFQVGDTTKMTAKIITYDAVMCDVELWHAVPTPTQTVKLDINKAEFVNQITDNGYYMLRGYTADSLYFVCMAPTTTEAIAGTYINDGKFSGFGAEDGRYDFYGDYCYIYKYATGESVGVVMDKAEMTVTENNGIITATATLIGHDSVQYEVTFTSSYNTHLPYDAEEGAIDRTYNANDNLSLEVYDGAVSLELTAADGSDICLLYFYPEELDSDIKVAPGVYTIDDTQDYNTVLANPGVQGTSVSPSFYAFLSEDGQGIITPMYLLVGGTVTVEKKDSKLYMEVNAVNSYDVPVHIIYDGTQTTSALDNVQTQSTITKTFKNGQLIIMKNGKVYNAQGAAIK